MFEAPPPVVRAEVVVPRGLGLRAARRAARVGVAGLRVAAGGVTVVVAAEV